jgi:hypothetical protein
MNASVPPPDTAAAEWQLALRRVPATGGWQAELSGPDGPVHFDSLTALIRWLAQLETPCRDGIR